ncbi:DUF7210 family protein [Phocoenobacter skyensis]|uniref:DUF7210 domain-containing protein n=1 Tax=Phocoenobacter skyensis TaxID=97481 RepID=A0ABT9JPM7_9PAST|nr:hypothetical protein [Pasteurella skyensis]MDP8080242.1 hypothetical protein [Pasteurella skyensis]MDP8086219.1 hypothetical protein [Pasteurella skyensis]
MSKTIKTTVKDTPLYHDGKRYEVGAEISLRETQYHELSIYLNEPIAESGGKEKPTEEAKKEKGKK